MTLSLRPLLFAVFSVARYRSISWTLNKTDEKCVHSFEQKSDRRLPKVSRRRMTCLDTRTFSRERRNSLAKYMEHHEIISSITLGHLRTFLMQSFHINVNSTVRYSLQILPSGLSYTTHLQDTTAWLHIPSERVTIRKKCKYVHISQLDNMHLKIQD